MNPSLKLNIPDEIAKPALKFGPWFIGAGLWAFSTFSDRLTWTEDVFARAFGALSGVYGNWTQVPGYGEALNEALQQVRRPPATILDLATGTGFVARQAKKLWPEATVSAMDISSEMVEVADALSHDEGLDIEFRVGKLSELPYENGSFDLVILQNAMPYPEEIMRVVGRGGMALIVWSYGGPWVSMAWPSLAKRLEKAGALTLSGETAGLGYYGIAKRS